MHGGERLRSVVHRVAIFNKEGTITDIVSQSDVIRCRAILAECEASASHFVVLRVRKFQSVTIHSCFYDNSHGAGVASLEDATVVSTWSDTVARIATLAKNCSD